MFPHPKHKSHSKLTFNNSAAAPAVTRLYARLEKLQKAGVPSASFLKSKNSISHFSSQERRIAMSQQKQRNFKYDFLGRNSRRLLQGAADAHSVIYDYDNNKLPYIQSKSSLTNVGKSNKKGNQTNVLLIDPLKEDSEREFTIKKQKTSKELSRKPMRVPPGKIIPLKYKHESVKRPTPSLEKYSYATPHIETKKQRMGKYVKTNNVSPCPIHRRKFTIPSNNFHETSKLELPTEESYKNMVGLFQDIKDLVIEPKANGTQELCMKLCLYREERRDTADTGGSDRQTQEFDIGRNRANSQGGDEMERLLMISEKIKKRIRPSTEESPERNLSTFRIDVSGTIDGRSNNLCEHDIAQTSRIEEVSPEHERDTTVREFVAYNEKDLYGKWLEEDVIKMRAKLGIKEGESVGLTPALTEMGGDILRVEMVVAGIKFMEPLIIPRNIHAYEK